MRRSVAIVAFSTVLMVALSSGSSAKEIVNKGVCAIVAGATTYNKYVTLKCALDRSPGRYVIRKTVLEKDDKAAYRKLARFNGHKFKCDLVQTGTASKPGLLITNYDVKNCR